MNQASTKPAIGFIGLGIMGFSMASRLAAAGYPLNVYNRTRAKAEPLIEAGAHWHETPKALAEVSDVIFTIVGTPDDVRALYLGDDGLINHARSDAVLVDMTTSSPQLAEELAAHAKTRGVQKRGNGPLFVEAVFVGKGKHVDAAEVAIGSLTDQLLDRGDALRVGRLPEYTEKGFGLAHRRIPSQP